MSVGVIRDGDVSTADPCGAPPRASAEFSSNVLANGKGIVRIGDKYIPHPCPLSPPHVGVATGGSSTVLVNGKGAHRIGDAISCGSTGNSGSSNVLIG